MFDFLALLVQQYKSTILTQHAVDQHAGGQVLHFLALLVQQYKSTILTQHAVDQHAGGQQHAQLAKTGYMLAISHALRWASPGSPLGIEQVLK